MNNVGIKKANTFNLVYLYHISVKCIKEDEFCIHANSNRSDYHNMINITKKKYAHTDVLIFLIHVIITQVRLNQLKTK